MHAVLLEHCLLSKHVCILLQAPPCLQVYEFSVSALSHLLVLDTREQCELTRSTCGVVLELTQCLKSKCNLPMKERSAASS